MSYDGQVNTYYIPVYDRYGHLWIDNKHFNTEEQARLYGEKMSVEVKDISFFVGVHKFTINPKNIIK